MPPIGPGVKPPASTHPKLPAPSITAAWLLDLPAPAGTNHNVFGPEPPANDPNSTVSITAAWTPSTPPDKITLPNDFFYPINDVGNITTIADEDHVEWAANYYVVTPVTLVLAKMYSNVQISTQVIPYGIVWKYHDSTASGEVPFACIQYFSQSSIKGTEWTGTSLTGNALAITKRLVNRAVRHKVQCVAAFDWRALILLKFTTSLASGGNTSAVAAAAHNSKAIKWNLFSYLLDALDAARKVSAV